MDIRAEAIGRGGGCPPEDHQLLKMEARRRRLAFLGSRTGAGRSGTGDAFGAKALEFRLAPAVAEPKVRAHYLKQWARWALKGGNLTPFIVEDELEGD
jgi:hypothetical protein